MIQPSVYRRDKLNLIIYQRRLMTKSNPII